MEIKLNLIPPERKEEIVKNNRLKLAVRLEMFFTAALIIFFAVLLSFEYILNFSLALDSTVKEEGGKVSQYEEIKNYDSQFSQINSQISKIMKVKGEQLYWSVLFAKLGGMVFPGIEIESLSTADYAVAVSGISNTRDSLLLFKEKMEKENCFSNVGLPLSNLIDKSNIEFQIDFNIDRNCLRK